MSIQLHTGDTASGRMPIIMCAICKKPVDHVYWSRDCHDKSFFIRVKCHGDTDSMTAGSFELYEMQQSGSMKAEAFATKRIDPPAPAE